MSSMLASFSSSSLFYKAHGPPLLTALVSGAQIASFVLSKLKPPDPIAEPTKSIPAYEPSRTIQQYPEESPTYGIMLMAIVGILGMAIGFWTVFSRKRPPPDDNGGGDEDDNTPGSDNNGSDSDSSDTNTTASGEEPPPPPTPAVECGACKKRRSWFRWFLGWILYILIWSVVPTLLTFAVARVVRHYATDIELALQSPWAKAKYKQAFDYVLQQTSFGAHIRQHWWRAVEFIVRRLNDIGTDPVVILFVNAVPRFIGCGIVHFVIWSVQSNLSRVANPRASLWSRIFALPWLIVCLGFACAVRPLSILPLLANPPHRLRICGDDCTSSFHGIRFPLPSEYPEWIPDNVRLFELSDKNFTRAMVVIYGLISWFHRQTLPVLGFFIQQCCQYSTLLLLDFLIQSVIFCVSVLFWVRYYILNVHSCSLSFRWATFFIRSVLAPVFGFSQDFFFHAIYPAASIKSSFRLFFYLVFLLQTQSLMFSFYLHCAAFILFLLLTSVPVPFCQLIFPSPLVSHLFQTFHFGLLSCIPSSFIYPAPMQTFLSTFDSACTTLVP
ncbi:hypothetical protein FB45DRAFT_1023216 [Roridomyces roridus]|uniref:Uncharacterized protein n=1 Tax=Roridomyces roridus TaxID=1738132 RepID=A0AAD7C478_9AGAR|nr:hypothetical protein FB45DRAFT_1023216 [Roridomyces roridus]